MDGAKTSLPPVTDPLQDFEHSTFTHDGKSRDVYEMGEGPAVIVMAEIPGITPKVAAFARRVAGIGCTVVLPRLFGVAGAEPTMVGVLRTIGPACVSKEFAAFAANRTAPVTVWLRALAADAHERCGGPGVGALGMCFTGGFALGMMVDDRLIAPVLSQPSLPLPVSAKARRGLQLSDADLARVKARAADGVCVLGLRFTATWPSTPRASSTSARSWATTSSASRSTRHPATRGGSPRTRTRC